jgi:hypothetical protein
MAKPQNEHNELRLLKEKKVFMNKFHKHVLEFERAMLKEIDGNPGHVTHWIYNWNYDIKANDDLRAMMYRLEQARRESAMVFGRDEYVNKLLVIGMYSMFAYFQAKGEIMNFNEWWDAAHPEDKTKTEIKPFNRFEVIDLV